MAFQAAQPSYADLRMQTIALIDLKFRWVHARLRECLDATGHRYSVKMKEVRKSVLPLTACR